MIKVYFDTNMLEDYAEKSLIISDKILSEKFYSFIKQVSENTSLHSVMTIVISQVVIDEIRQHVKETFKYIEDITLDLKSKILKVYKTFDDAQEFIFQKGEADVLSGFEKEINDLVQKYPFVVVEKHKNTINNIYYKALHKLPPFYKKNPKLDSGFKDAILWKTAIENKGASTVIICTADDDFDGCEIEIIKSFEILMNRIQKEYLSKKELIKSFINDGYIKERIADELGYHEFDNINLELLNYFEIDNPQFYDFEIIKIKATIDKQVVFAEFNINIPTNEIELYQIIK